MRKSFHLPPSILRHRNSDPEAGVVDPLADRVHVQDRVYAVGPAVHAALGRWAEAAVVQALVTVVVATLLQGDSGGQPRNTNVDHQLLTSGTHRWQRVFFIFY